MTNVKEYQWHLLKRKLLPCLGYKSDGVTLDFSKKHLYPLSQVFGPVYEEYAVQMNESFILFYLVGKYWTRSCYIEPWMTMEQFKEGVDRLINSKANKKETWISRIDNACSNGKWVSLVELEMLKQWDDTAGLIMRCIIARAEYKRLIDEEYEAKAKAQAAEDAAEEADYQKQLSDLKQTAIQQLLNGEVVNNHVSISTSKRHEDIYMIPLLCAENGIKISPRTLGWIKEKLGKIVRCKDGSFTIWYLKNTARSKPPERIVEILSELYKKIKEVE